MYHYSWLQDIPGLPHLLEELTHGTHSDVVAIMTTWFVAFLLLGLALLARKQLDAAIAKGGIEQYVPDGKLTIRNSFELLTGWIDELLQGFLNKTDARTFYWLLGGFFTYILVNNLMGVVPGMAPPTDNISNNLALALVSFVAYNVIGISRQGLGPYLKHLAGPVWWLAPLFIVVEGLGLFIIRPLTLTLRLTGNIFGDHMVFGIMSDLTHGIVIPFLFLGLGIFVSFIQALVFTLLSCVYISFAVAHEDHGHEAAHH